MGDVAMDNIRDFKVEINVDKVINNQKGIEYLRRMAKLDNLNGVSIVYDNEKDKYYLMPEIYASLYLFSYYLKNDLDSSFNDYIHFKSFFLQFIETIENFKKANKI